ncbi:MAG: hypothetical protein AABW56_00790 [Nanoarchaeota archaeon]
MNKEQRLKLDEVIGSIKTIELTGKTSPIKIFDIEGTRGGYMTTPWDITNTFHIFYLLNRKNLTPASLYNLAQGILGSKIKEFDEKKMLNLFLLITENSLSYMYNLALENGLGIRNTNGYTREGWYYDKERILFLRDSPIVSSLSNLEKALKKHSRYASFSFNHEQSPVPKKEEFEIMKESEFYVNSEEKDEIISRLDSENAISIKRRKKISCFMWPDGVEGFSIPTNRFGEDDFTIFAFKELASEFGDFLKDKDGLENIYVKLENKDYIDNQNNPFLIQNTLQGRYLVGNHPVRLKTFFNLSGNTRFLLRFCSQNFIGSIFNQDN